MRKQQEQMKLSELINTSEIFTAIQKLENNLIHYQKMNTGKIQSYQERSDINNLRKDVIDLKNTLHYLAVEFPKREALE